MNSKMHKLITDKLDRSVNCLRKEPRIVILIAASARPTLNRVAHWNLHHKEAVRLVLGGGVVVMGLLILITV